MLISWLPFHLLTVLRDRSYARMNPPISLSPHTHFDRFWVTETTMSYISTLPTNSDTHKSWFSALNENAVSHTSQWYANSWGRWFIHLWFIFSSLEVAFHGFQTVPHLFALTVMKKTDVRTSTERTGETRVGGCRTTRNERELSPENSETLSLSCWGLAPERAWLADPSPSHPPRPPPHTLSGNRL